MPTRVAITIRPNDDDILFGRGKPFQVHPGNMRMKQIVEPYTTAYQSAPRHVKTLITKYVIQVIKDSATMPNFDGGGHPSSLFTSNRPPRRTTFLIRFLKLQHHEHHDSSRKASDEEIHDESIQWIEASSDEIFNKVSHCLRRKASSHLRTSSSSMYCSRQNEEKRGMGCRETKKVDYIPFGGICPVFSMSSSRPLSQHTSMAGGTSIISKNDHSPQDGGFGFLGENIFDHSRAQSEDGLLSWIRNWDDSTKKEWSDADDSFDLPEEEEPFFLFDHSKNLVRPPRSAMLFDDRCSGGSTTEHTSLPLLAYYLFNDPGSTPPSPSIFD